MILSDTDILEELGYGITITPWDPKYLQPASVDLTLGNEFIELWEDGTAAINPFELTSGSSKVTIKTALGEDHYLLKPGAFALASTQEVVELSAKFSGQLAGKSSLGRLGLQVHATAGFVDPGFSGRITLELSNVGPRPIMLFPEMAIGQIVFTQVKTPSTNPYAGKYQCQTVVTESKYHLNSM